MQALLFWIALLPPSAVAAPMETARQEDRALLGADTRPPSARPDPVVVAAMTGPQPDDPAVRRADPDRDDDAEALRRLVEELAAEIRRLNERLAELEARARRDDADADADADARRLAEARRAAEERIGTEAPAERGVDTGTVFRSGTRMQPQLNPEISITGDVLVTASDGGDERFSNREWEVDFRSDLDPYSRLRLTLAKPEGEEIEIEEGYIDWLNLPGGMLLSLGQRRQQFGVLNRWHLHALDQTDYPLVLLESFGEEGLAGMGVHGEWSLPWLWADANELVIEITNGDNEVAFAGDDFDRPAYLGRLKSYWDVGPAGYFEFGLNGLFGRADAAGDLNSNFYAVDWTWFWSPLGRGRYRSFTARGLVLRTRRDLESGMTRRAWGGYAYGEFRFNRRVITGVRFDRADVQTAFGEHRWAVSPYFTLWQSEFVRLRAQYDYLSDNLLGPDRTFTLQVTFAAGPHKHEAY